MTGRSTTPLPRPPDKPLPSGRRFSRRELLLWPPAWWALLLGIVLVSTVARGIAGAFVPTPWIEPDEVVYAELGRSLWTSGHMTIFDAPTRFYSLVYPAFVGGPLSLHDRAFGYDLLKWLQALVMSAAAVPVYFWGRRLAGSGWALVAAALTVSMPGLAYSGLVMSEVAFYPVVVLVAWAWARALETGGVGRQLLAVGAVVLAMLTRVQALALIPALPTAVLLMLVFRRTRNVRPFLPLLAGAALAAAGWTAWLLVGGHTATNALGAYRAAGETSYDAGDAARYVVYHAADVLLLTGIIPACVVVLFLVEAFQGRTARPDWQAHLAVTAAITGWFVFEVGVFASRHVGFLAERNLFAVGPLFFLGLVTWLRRGAPRPEPHVAVIAAGALVLLAILPLRTLATRDALPDTFSLIPLYRVRNAFPNDDPRPVLFVLALGAVGLLLLVRRPLEWIPAALLVVLAGGAVLASTTVVSEARFVQTKLLGGADRDWVDDGASGPVVFVHAGGFWNATYENRFWSRRLVRVYVLPGQGVPGPAPTAPVGPRFDGRVVFASGRPAPARFVVASNIVTFFGTELAQAEGADLALWSVRPPLRMSTWLTGMGLVTTTGDANGNLEATGDIGADAHLVVYGCERGLLKLSLESQFPTRVRITKNDRLLRVVTLVPGGGWSDDLRLVPTQVPGPSGSGHVRVPQCSFDIVSLRPLHVPRLELVRD